MGLGLEFPYQFPHRFFRLDRIAAGEDVNGGVATFGPGVDEEVGFGNDDYSAHSLGGKLVKGFSQDGGTGGTCRRGQNALDYA